MTPDLLRPDLNAIAAWIAPRSSVLDVGCGEGDLLAWLAARKNVRGRGIELSQEKVGAALARGLSVVQADADSDLGYYPDASCDYAVSSQAIQAMRNPKAVLAELARIGRRAIVSAPNFGNWKNRAYLGLKGRMPVTKTLSYQWYETPNIHFCTIADFVELCESMNLVIARRAAIHSSGRALPFRGKGPLANLTAEQGVFLLERKIER